MTGYGPIPNKVVGKPVNLPQWFDILLNGKKIDKHLVFLCSPLTFAWYVLHVTQFDVWNYFEPGDKKWRQYKSKQLCYEKNLNRGYWFNRKSKLLPLLDIIFVSNWLNSICYLFWVWGKNMTTIKTKIFMLWEKFHLWVFIRLAITNLTFAWYYFCFDVTQPCNRNNISFWWLIKTTQWLCFD